MPTRARDGVVWPGAAAPQGPERGGNYRHKAQNVLAKGHAEYSGQMAVLVVLNAVVADGYNRRRRLCQSFRVACRCVVQGK